LIENNYRPLIIHSKNTSLETIKKMTRTNSSTEFLRIEKHSIPNYIINIVNKSPSYVNNLQLKF